MKPVDVVVVGGGPAGSAVATLVAERGVRVTVMERCTFPRPKVCGEFVSVEARGTLGRLGVLDELLGEGASRIDSVRVTSMRGRELTAPLPDLPGVGRSALGVSRETMDTRLLDRASRAGARVLERVQVVQPVVERGRVRAVRFRSVPGGAIRTLPASLVVGADGRRSRVARALHSRPGDPSTTVPGSWFGLATHVVAPGAGPGPFVELHLFPSGYAGVGAVEGNRINVCLMTRVRALRSCGGSPDRLLSEAVQTNPAAARRLRGARRVAGWSAVGPLRFGVRRPAAAGVAFVGDAAGTIDPFCGEGIAHALRGAEIVAPYAVEAAARGGLDEELSSAYDAAWRDAFAGATRRVRCLGRLFDRPRLASLLVDSMERFTPRTFAPLVAATRTGVIETP